MKSPGIHPSYHCGDVLSKIANLGLKLIFWNISELSLVIINNAKIRRAREFLGDLAFDQLLVHEEPNYQTQNKYKFIRLRKKCLIAPAT